MGDPLKTTNLGAVDCDSLRIAGQVVVSLQNQAAVIAALTENTGAIAGTNDGNLPDLTATYIARTGALGGSANGSLVDELTLSTSNTYSDAAVNLVIGKLKDNLAEVHAVVLQLAADNVALRAAIREVAAKQNATLASLKTSTLMANA